MNNYVHINFKLRLRPDLIPDVHMEVRYKSSIIDFSQLSIGVFLADMRHVLNNEIKVICS